MRPTKLEALTTLDEEGILVDSDFHFLTDAQANLLNEILTRRNPELFQRLRRSSSLSCADAGAIMNALSDELTNNLDDEWEPTEDGRNVSTVLAQFNRARLLEWPALREESED